MRRRRLRRRRRLHVSSPIPAPRKTLSPPSPNSPLLPFCPSSPFRPPRTAPRICVPPSVYRLCARVSSLGTPVAFTCTLATKDASRRFAPPRTSHPPSDQRSSRVLLDLVAAFDIPVCSVGRVTQKKKKGPRRFPLAAAAPVSVAYHFLLLTFFKPKLLIHRRVYPRCLFAVSLIVAGSFIPRHPPSPRFCPHSPRSPPRGQLGRSVFRLPTRALSRSAQHHLAGRKNKGTVSQPVRHSVIVTTTFPSPRGLPSGRHPAPPPWALSQPATSTLSSPLFSRAPPPHRRPIWQLAWHGISCLVVFIGMVIPLEAKSPACQPSPAQPRAYSLTLPTCCALLPVLPGAPPSLPSHPPWTPPGCFRRLHPLRAFAT